MKVEKITILETKLIFHSLVFSKSYGRKSRWSFGFLGFGVGESHVFPNVFPMRRPSSPFADFGGGIWKNPAGYFTWTWQKSPPVPPPKKGMFWKSYRCFFLLFQENEVLVVWTNLKDPDTPPVSDGIPINIDSPSTHGELGGPPWVYGVMLHGWGVKKGGSLAVPLQALWGWCFWGKKQR